MAEDKGFGDKLKGAVSKGKGELKDQVGNATDDSRLQAEGKKDKAKGDIQDKVGDFKKDFNK
ncbi:CsbD family protein [Planococcus koreensis]|uniref:CsbD family protein n=1 Tax=Planococcus koreensis TaxID=112331 RepID=UPI0039FCCE90